MTVTCARILTLTKVQFEKKIHVCFISEIKQDNKKAETRKSVTQLLNIYFKYFLPTNLPTSASWSFNLCSGLATTDTNTAVP